MGGAHIKSGRKRLSPEETALARLVLSGMSVDEIVGRLQLDVSDLYRRLYALRITLEDELDSDHSSRRDVSL
ncbi:MAG TPA: hypothetical protein VFK89_10895 [Actinomycetota bacterium]|nr:hypothetical protein [Actinomycetota bacterium]